MGKHSKEDETWFWIVAIIAVLVAVFYFAGKYGTSIWGN